MIIFAMIIFVMFRIFIIFVFSKAVFNASLASGSIKNFDNKFGLGIVVDNHDYALTLTPSSESFDNKVIYRPNTVALSGFQGSWKGFSLAYLSKAPVELESVQLKGKTSYEDLRGALFFGDNDRWGFLGYYNRFKGLFIDNSNKIDSSIGVNDPKIQRPDIEVFGAGAALIYVFSPDKLSLAASYLQSSRQTRSGGSWVGMLNFDAATLSADSQLVPTSLNAEFGQDAGLSAVDYLTTSASLGYGYTLVGGPFYLSGIFLIGKGQQARTYKIDGNSRSSNANTSRTNIGLSLGLNSDSFFTALTFAQDNNQFFTDSISFNAALATVRLFFGGRF